MRIFNTLTLVLVLMAAPCFAQNKSNEPIPQMPKAHPTRADGCA